MNPGLPVPIPSRVVYVMPQGGDISCLPIFAVHVKVFSRFKDNNTFFWILRLVGIRQAHDVNTTSLQRRCNVMTLHRR